MNERGTQTDLDLMVTFLPDVKPGLEFFSMQDELEQLFGCSVDLLTRRSVERSENEIRRLSILNSAREIYSFRKIAGMRNRVVHDYGHIDFEIIWETPMNCPT